MTPMLLPFLLAAFALVALVAGVGFGRRLTVAHHQGARRQSTDAMLMQGGVTLFTVLYGLFLQPTSVLWPLTMLLASALGLMLGQWHARRTPSRELSSAQLRTDAILER